MRIAGVAGQVMAKLGVIPQQVAGGDIYPSLERGTIDAAEWIGPYDDEKLGFQKVAPYLLLSGLLGRRPDAALLLQQGQVGIAAEELQGDRWRPPAWPPTWTCSPNTTPRTRRALRSLVGAGAQLRPFPQEMLDAAYKATNEVYAEISAKNAGLQEDHRLDPGVPERGISLVPSGRVFLRHLHDPRPHARLRSVLSCKTDDPAPSHGAGFSFGCAPRMPNLTSPKRSRACIHAMQT